MAQTTITAAALLDPDVLHSLVTLPLSTEPVSSQVTTATMINSHNMRVPRVVADPVAGFVGEGDEIPITSATVDEIVITPAKIAALDSVTRETLSDSTIARTEFGKAMVRSLGTAADKFFFGGAGSDPIAPKGLPDQVGVTTIPAGATWADLDVFADAVTAVEGVGASVTHWIAHPSDAGALRKLKSASGSNSPLLATDPAAGARRVVEGAPVLVSPHVEAGTIWAVDKSRILTVIRESGTEATISDGPYFTSDRLAMRVTARLAWGFIHPESIAKVVLTP